MQDKRAVEHYKDHEIICVAAPDSEGWHYTVSIVGHRGDKSAVHTAKSGEIYKSEMSALQAAAAHGRRLVDNRLA